MYVHILKIIQTRIISNYLKSFNNINKTIMNESEATQSIRHLQI